MTLYVPPHFATADRAAIARLVHDHPFATLLTVAGQEPVVTHLPLVLVPDCEPWGTLVGHFARANPHAGIAAGGPSIAVFHGPHAYVSPSWYADPGASVPTWNYAVAHLHGTVELAADAEQTQAVLGLLIDRFESERAMPWRPALDAARAAAMVGAIVGFRIRVTHVDAKFKLSQNRSADDRQRVAAALAGDGHADATATAEWMRAYVPGARGGEA